MKRQPIFFGQELQQHPNTAVSGYNPPACPAGKSLNTASFSVYVPCNAARKLCHFTVEIPEGIRHIPLVTRHRCRSGTLCTFVRRPALYQPARSRIHFLQRLPAIGRQRCSSAFRIKRENVTGRLFRYIEMSPARITKKRDAASPDTSSEKPRPDLPGLPTTHTRL